MLDELMVVGSSDTLDKISVGLMDEESLRSLQEEMSSRQLAFNRSDYWPADVVVKRTRNSAAVRKALREVVKEPDDKKLLHLLQMISATTPGASEGISRFLKRVTFG